jgi:hypothetical protein
MRISSPPNRQLGVLASLTFSGLAWAQSGAGVAPQKPAPYANPALPVTAGAVPSRGIDPGSLTLNGTTGNTLTNWTGSFASNGATYTYTMLGTDPAAGSATTTIPAVLIPLKVVFSDGTILDATSPVYGETASALRLTEESPLFQAVTFSPGGTTVGHTQYIDAFQRANFWNYVSTAAAGYHVRFSVTTEPAQTLTVPAYFGYSTSGPGSPIGNAYYNWWDGQLGVLLYRLKIKPNTLAIFLNYNIEQYSSDFTYAGYHTAFGSPAQVYISAGFYDQGIFTYGGDIVFLSHEMGESTDDPFVNNIVPGWNNPQTPGSCSDLLEIGDPVSDQGIRPVILNGYTYHPEDLAFLSWFSGAVPSTSVNAWYTFGNYYSSPATCTN